MTHKKGFTLVELLVVTTIGITIFTVGIASYRDFSRRQSLTSIASSLKSDLRLAQQLALTGQKPDSVVCTRLEGYSIDRINSYTYALIANCSNNDFTVKTIDLPSSISISASADPTEFKVLGQGTNLSATNTMILTLTATGNTEIVTIGIGGEIQ